MTTTLNTNQLDGPTIGGAVPIIQFEDAWSIRVLVGQTFLTPEDRQDDRATLTRRDYRVDFTLHELATFETDHNGRTERHNDRYTVTVDGRTFAPRTDSFYRRLSGPNGFNDHGTAAAAKAFDAWFHGDLTEWLQDEAVSVHLADAGAAYAIVQGHDIQERLNDLAALAEHYKTLAARVDAGERLSSEERSLVGYGFFYNFNGKFEKRR